MSRLLDRQGCDVICAVLSAFEETRRWNRAHLPRYFEVYLRVPFETLVERDPKGLYRRARSGELPDVVGVDIPFEEPQRPDLILDNAQPTADFSTFARRILEALPRDLWA